ncbi:MAG TPA: ribosome maturation factor RimP [Acetobacteraceae bacterium]|nr:ribosome maturation factor RimP [Acetobacteraceae bacterium]
MADRVPATPESESRLAELVSPTLEAMGYELVRVAITGGARPTVQIMAERKDGEAMAIEDCEAISHALGAVLDVADPLPNAWALEVSSPGIDRPLTRVKDWNRFAGHLARVELAEPIEGRRRASGVVLGADERVVRLRRDDGAEMALPLAAIRRAKLVLTEALIAATAPAKRNNGKQLN